MTTTFARQKPLRIGMVAGEASGDVMGASLITALQKLFPHALFEGLGGPLMIAQGFKSFYPMERLSVMGFIEPLKRLAELISIRRHLRQHFIRAQFDVFIGIDAPDFNLGLEQSLKKAGLKTVHYVSPTVWAWRQGRIKKIKKAVDLMLTLFPFESDIYAKHQIKQVCVGHPLADQIPLVSDKIAARNTLQLSTTAKIVALLPGSRKQELTYLSRDFILTAQWLYEQDPTLEFVVACSNELRAQEFVAHLQQFPTLPIKLFTQQTRAVMTAADVLLACSGTVTLEAMLIKRPTLVAYKMSPFTFAIAKRLVKIPFIALPNLLAQQEIMPEFVQTAVQPAQMGQQILALLRQPELLQKSLGIFTRLHQELKRNADVSAANAIAALLGEQDVNCRSG